MRKTNTRTESAAQPKTKRTVATRVVATENVPIPAPYVEADEMQAIEIALADAEQDMLHAEYKAAFHKKERVTDESRLAEITLNVAELIEYLIYNGSKRCAGTVATLAYQLCDVLPGLKSVSEQADRVVCHSHGITHNRDITSELERAVNDDRTRRQAAK